MQTNIQAEKIYLECPTIMPKHIRYLARELVTKIADEHHVKGCIQTVLQNSMCIVIVWNDKDEIQKRASQLFRNVFTNGVTVKDFKMKVLYSKPVTNVIEKLGLDLSTFCSVDSPESGTESLDAISDIGFW